MCFNVSLRVLCTHSVRGVGFSFTLIKLATETSQRKNGNRCVTPTSRTGDASMKAKGQSLRDPYRQMGKGSARHHTSVISSEYITQLDPVENKINPNSFLKHGLTFGTWNVLSLVSSSSQLFQLSQCITQYRLDLLGITETHIPGTGTELLENGSVLIYSGRVDSVKRQGVGLSLSKRIKNSLISYVPVSERILTARLHSKQLNISVVVVYAPTEGASDADKDTFYQQLSSTFDELPRHDLKLLLGDLNAQITSDNSTCPSTIGKHSLHSSSNDNGTRFVDFCMAYQLVIGGSLFQRKDIHKGTWRSPNGRTVNQIDHVCISKRFRGSLLDVKVCRGADIGSDHYLVRGRLRIKLLSTKKRQGQIPVVPAIEHLRDRSLIAEYNVALQNRFECLDPETNLEEMWHGFKSSVSQVSMEVLGQRPRKRKEQHLSEKTKDLLAKRGEFKRRDPESDANRSEYSRLNKLVKKSSRTDDNNWALRMASELEEAASKGQQREVWQKIYVISGKKKRQSAAVRDRSGVLIADPHAQKERWKEHFSELLNPPAREADLSDLDHISPQPNFEYLADTDEAPTGNEVVDALKKLKNHKSPGVDGITNEQLKYGEAGLVAPLVQLFGKVWEEERIPEDWSKGVVVVIGKKGDTSYCANNRGITLRSTTSKLLQIILLKRLLAGLESLLRESQCGFRKNRSCIDQIYSLRCIIQESIEFNLPLYVNFVDFKAAFDSIDRQFIWRTLEHYGLPGKYIRIMKAFFTDTVSAVRVNGDLTDWFSVNSGTGQGDIQGPPVFNFCLNFAAYLMEHEKVVSKGMVLELPVPSEGNEGKHLLDTDYADDMALLDNTVEGLQETTDLLCKNSAYAGLKVNAKKTQCMAVSKSASQRPYTQQDTLDLTVEGQPIEQVSNFTYLGAIISADGTINRELSARIQKASGAFHQLGSIWQSRSIRTPTKIRIYKAAVLTILLYGSEVWNTTKEQMRRFEVFHQRCLRKILKIRWNYFVSNAEVLERAKIKPVETFISAARLRWFGHVVRMPKERVPNYLLEWKPTHGKRSRGRPRKNWRTCVLEDAASFMQLNSVTMEEIKQQAINRVQWRSMIRQNKDSLCGAGHSND